MPGPPEHPNIKVMSGLFLRSVSKVGLGCPCHMLSLIFLRCSFIVHKVSTPGSVLLARLLTFCVLEYSRRTGWHGLAGNSTWEKAIGSTACSTACRREGLLPKNIIIQKCGTKTLQERGAEQKGSRRMGQEGEQRQSRSDGWAVSLSISSEL